MVIAHEPTRAFHLLGDPVRWRILRLLARQPLTVTETTLVVGLAQSGISRHLGLLKDAGLVREERRGGWSFFSIAVDAPPGLLALWGALTQDLAQGPDRHGDDARLAEVLRERSERDEDLDPRAALEPGRSWAAWSQALALLVPALEVVQLGCGRGALAFEVARWARRLVAVEPDARSAAAACERLAGQTHATVLGSGLDAVAAPAASFDLALVAQVLSSAAEPGALLREARRLLKPGGRALILDLLTHDERWVLARLGHRRLGWRPEEVRDLLLEAGFERPRVQAAERRRGNPFVVLMAVAERA